MKQNKKRIMYEFYINILIWNASLFFFLIQYPNLIIWALIGNSLFTLFLASVYEKYSYTVEDIIDKVLKNSK